MPKKTKANLELDGDSTERAFFRDFRDVNHQNDLGIG